ncbi:Variant-specific surface protein [Giardia duodenalis]|uniref:Variant-specific surface protein n=1 Tax=Giardia intestinalis TaxID=5741 RepID=V6TPM9_GIAIN|nr:Variant-specific surface protein [Giardia intestinalis]
MKGYDMCTKPANINTAPACDECSSGYTLEDGKCASSSANRSGLSTGAIAGISVAAIVVVGGLVGFLCWWFVCRGKA